MEKYYGFDRDALCALYSLLNIVHYDDLAQGYLDLLPMKLREDLLNATWMDDEKWVVGDRV